jgi:hypothetical protein
MKRNSGIIGSKSNVSSGGAVGLFDTFDVYNFRRAGSWPQPISYNSLFPNSGDIFENTSVSFSLSTSGISVSTTLYWTVLNGSTLSTDFNGSISGSFTQSASTNTGSFNIATNFICNLAKASKTFQVQIRTGSTSGPVVYTSGVYNIPSVTVTSYFWTSASINEGSSSTLQVQFGNCGSFASHTFDLTYTGTASPTTDFTASLPSTVFTNPGLLAGYLTVTALNDITTEGTETLIATPRIPGFGSSSIGTAPTLTINDTSVNATGTITPSTTSVTEGTSVTFNCTVSGSFTGTVFYSVDTAGSNVQAADFSDGVLSGSFSVTGGSGSFVKTLVADGVAEVETFRVNLRTGSTTGTILATTASISIVDAAAPAASWSTDIITSTGSNTGTTANVINNNYRRYLLIWTYTAAELQAATGRTSATISGLRFSVTQQPTYQPYPNYAIGLKNVGGSVTSTTNPGSTGFTIVKAQASESFTTGVVKEFTLSPFTWTGSNLSIAVAWGQVPTNFSGTGTSPRGAGTLYIGRLDTAGTFVINTDTTSTTAVNGRPVVQLFCSA